MASGGKITYLHPVWLWGRHCNTPTTNGEFHEDLGTSMSPFLLLMHTWTCQMCEGPPGCSPHVKHINSRSLYIKHFLLNFPYEWLKSAEMDFICIPLIIFSTYLVNIFYICEKCGYLTKCANYSLLIDNLDF